jgi:hypothetical protein
MGGHAKSSVIITLTSEDGYGKKDVKGNETFKTDDKQRS